MDTTIIEATRRDATNQVGARLAVTAAERLAAFRLRYSVYIAEQGKPYPEANHEDELLSDELDADGDIIAVEFNGLVIGTVRANSFDSPLTRARYAHVFELNQFSEIKLSEMVACSRLAASAEHRHEVARGLLFEGIYEHRLKLSTHLCFATCAPVLVRLFRRYGFREYAPPIHDPIVGPLHRTLLVLDDLDHIAKIRSPFEPIAKRNGVKPISRPWLTKLFDDYKARREELK